MELSLKKTRRDQSNQIVLTKRIISWAVPPTLNFSILVLHVSGLPHKKASVYLSRPKTCFLTSDLITYEKQSSVALPIKTDLLIFRRIFISICPSFRALPFKCLWSGFTKSCKSVVVSLCKRKQDPRQLLIRAYKCGCFTLTNVSRSVNCTTVFGFDGI